MKILIIITALLASLTPFAHAQIGEYEEIVAFNNFTAAATPIPDIDGSGDRVTLDWVHRTNSGEILRAHEDLAVSFTPELVHGLGGGRLLVCGTSSASSHTIVQVWLLRKPQVLYTFPTGDPVITTQGVARIVTLQDSNEANRSGVLWASSLRGSSTLLVKYRSGHIWEHYLTGGAPRLYSSPDGEPGTVHTPGGAYYFPVLSTNHVDHGSLVVVYSRHSSHPNYLLQDADNDGRLDSWIVLTAGLRQSMGIDDPTKRIY